MFLWHSVFLNVTLIPRIQTENKFHEAKHKPDQKLDSWPPLQHQALWGVNIKNRGDVTYRVSTIDTWSQKVFDFEGRRRTPPRIGKSRKKKQRKQKKPSLHEFCPDDLVTYLETEKRKSLEVKKHVFTKF